MAAARQDKREIVQIAQGASGIKQGKASKVSERVVIDVSDAAEGRLRRFGCGRDIC